MYWCLVFLNPSMSGNQGWNQTYISNQFKSRSLSKGAITPRSHPCCPSHGIFSIALRNHLDICQVRGIFFIMNAEGNPVLFNKQCVILHKVWHFSFVTQIFLSRIYLLLIDEEKVELVKQSHLQALLVEVQLAAEFETKTTNRASLI